MKTKRMLALLLTLVMLFALAVPVTALADEEATCTVTFNPNGGTLAGNTSVQVEAGGTVSTDAAPTSSKDGEKFTGWYTECAAPDGGTISQEFVLGETKVNTDITVTAHYKAVVTAEQQKQLEETGSAKGGELTRSNDAVVTSGSNNTLPEPVDGVIDLNGGTYTLTSAYTQSSGNVTIKDGTISTDVTDVFDVTGGTLTLGEGLTVSTTSSALYAHNGGIINIAGATVTGTGTDYSLAYATGSGSAINISSGSLVKNGSNHVTLSIDGGATSTISGGTVSNNASSTIVAKNGGVITVSGGTVSNSAESPNYCAAYSTNGGKIILTNIGTIRSEYGWGLVATKNSTVQVDGGYVYGGTKDDVKQFAVLAHEGGTATAILNRGVIEGPVRAGSSSGAGTVNINYTQTDAGNSNSSIRGDLSAYNGGSIVAESGYVTGNVTAFGGGTITMSGNINVDGYVYSTDENSAITINGDYSTLIGGTVYAPANGATLSITGGTFSNDPSAVLTAGYAAALNASGKYVVKLANEVAASIGNVKYATIQDAVNAAGTEETEITLLNNVANSVYVNDGQTITLNLNGKTISGGSITVYNGGTLTINGTGEIVNTDTNSYCVIYDDGTLTINGGTVSGVLAYGGSVTINGGSFSKYVYTYNNGTITINGGTFADNNPVNYGATVASGKVFAKVADKWVVGDLATVIAAADTNDTVTLLRDVDLTSGLNITKAITIDGGNKTVTLKNNTANWSYAVKSSAALTLKDINFEAGDNFGSTVYATIWNDAGNLTLDHVTVSLGTTTSYYAVYNAASTAEISVSGCSLTANYPFRVQGDNNTVTLSNSTATSGWSTMSIYGSNNTVTVTGSTLSSVNSLSGDGNLYAMFVFHTDEATGNKINVTNSTLSVTANNTGNQALVGSYYGPLDGNDYDKDYHNTLTLGAGNNVTFTGDHAVFQYNSPTTAKSLVITGGTFNKNAATLTYSGTSHGQSLSDYIPEGYLATESGGKWTVAEHTHSYTASWNVWGMNGNNWVNPVVTFTCTCGDTVTEYATLTKSSPAEGKLVYTATAANPAGGVVTQDSAVYTQSFTVTYNGSSNTYTYGAVAHFNSGYSVDWKVYTTDADESTAVTRAKACTDFYFAVTENVTVTTATASTENLEVINIQQAASKGAKTFTYQVQWSLPATAENVTATIYRCRDDNSSITSAEALLAATNLRTWNCNMNTRNGDYTYNAINLTSGSKQTIMLKITYTLPGSEEVHVVCSDLSHIEIN